MKRLLILVTMLFGCLLGYSQTQFWQDDFENASTPDMAAGSTRIAENNSGVGGPPNTSYFKRTTGSDISMTVAYSAFSGSNFWAGEDHDTPFGAGNEEQQIEWTGINISGKTNLTFKGLLGANSTNGSWDNFNTGSGAPGFGVYAAPSNDYIIVEYAIDAGAYTQLMSFFSDNITGPVGTAKKLKEDTNGDFIGDGTTLNQSMTELVKTIPGTGTSMKLRIRVYSNGGNEEWGIDNFRLFSGVACTAPTVSLSEKTDVLCNGGSTGTATVSASGGSPFSYAWSPSGGSSAIATGLSIGTYSCVVTNSCGLTATQTVIINQPSALNSSTAATNPLCNGGNGSATVTATGGTAPYTYTWSSAPTSSVEPTLLAGSYTIKVTDFNGCNVTKTVTITQPPALITTTTVTNVLCNGSSTGSATITATGGTLPYSYLWSSSQTSSVVTSLNAGVRTVTVTDGNGCIKTNTVAISEPPILQANSFAVPVACYGNATTISVLAIGGTPGYTGATTYTAVAGTYSYIVTDAHGCAAMTSITVNQPSILDATTTVTNPLCFGQTGTAEIFAVGGTPGYSYTWSPAGGSAPNATNVSAGIYTVTVNDANGCVLTQTIEITEPTELQGFTNQLNITCVDNGQAEINAFGGTPAYTYSWSPAGGSGAVTSVLSQGDYTCVVTDANGCLLTKTLTILSNTIVPTLSVSGQMTICVGDSTVLTVTGADNYVWEPNTISSNTISVTPNVTSEYTVTGTDAINGCVSSVTQIVVVNPLPVISVISTSSILCTGETATLSATGANSYTWNTTETTSGIVVTPTLQTIYAVDGVDVNGCVSSGTFTQDVSLCTSLENALEDRENVSIYPNPSNGSFSISLTLKGSYLIVNSIGQTVEVIDITDNSQQVNINGLAQGIYYVIGKTVKAKVVVAN